MDTNTLIFVGLIAIGIGLLLLMAGVCVGISSGGALHMGRPSNSTAKTGNG